MVTLATASALLALAIAAGQLVLVLRTDEGSERTRAIAQAIREGATAFLRRELAAVAAVAVVIALAIVLAFRSTGNAAELAIGFLLGGVGSAIASVVGVLVSVRANVRTAVMASRSGLHATLRFAFSAGSVIGLAIAGLATLALVGCYELFGGNVPAMAGLLVGASLISLFARVGGGIYTKGADVGADLVGKLELQIPEDDPRNPAVIADNVGDNVGDCGGMAADLFETFLVTAVAAMLLGYLITDVRAVFPNAVLFPLAVSGCGILATIGGVIVVRLTRRATPIHALYRGLAATLVLGALGLWLLDRWVMAGHTGVLIATLTGLVVVVVLVGLTSYYTSPQFRPVSRIVHASEAGAGPVVISGLSVGLMSVGLPGLTIAAGTLAAFFATGWTPQGIDTALGLYGIGIAATSMLAVMGMIISIDAFGPIVDNAGGIAEMARLGAEARRVTDVLDEVGNTTKAITKGYAIGSAALAALALFAAYMFATADALDISFVELSHQLTLDNPLVVVGLFIGALLPFVFTSFLMNAVGVAAHAIVVEVRRQFAELGLADSSRRPEYGRCVAIVTSTALRQLITPGVLAVSVPLLVGFVLGPIALAGVLLGVILSGLPLALFMTTSGAAWDNAKKYVEQGHLGGKHSPAHGATIVGDTVGDATKDAAGPAINPLVKVVNTVSVLCVSFVSHQGWT